MSENPKEETFIQALRRNWFLLIPSVALVLLGFVLGNWPRDTYDASRNKGITDLPELKPHTPAARAANENFVKMPVGAAESYRKGVQAERRYLKQLEEMSPRDEEYPLTLFRLGSVYYSALYDYEKAIPYFEELIKDFPENPRTRTASNFLADCYMRIEQPEKAAAFYDTLIKEQPWESDLHKWAEKQLRQMPRTDDAQEN